MARIIHDFTRKIFRNFPREKTNYIASGKEKRKTACAIVALHHVREEEGRRRSFFAL